MFRGRGAAFCDEEGDDIPAATARIHREQTFDHLKGLDGISDAQIDEHLKLHAGYVKRVNGLTPGWHEEAGFGSPTRILVRNAICDGSRRDVGPRRRPCAGGLGAGG